MVTRMDRRIDDAIDEPTVQRVMNQCHRFNVLIIDIILMNGDAAWSNRTVSNRTVSSIGEHRCILQFFQKQSM